MQKALQAVEKEKRSAAKKQNLQHQAVPSLYDTLYDSKAEALKEKKHYEVSLALAISKLIKPSPILPE